MPYEDDELPAPPSPWRTAAVAVSVVVAVALGAAGLLHREALSSWARGESDWLGERRWQPPHPVERARLGRVDLAAVHERLLPAWLIALGRTDDATNDPHARTAFRELRAEAGKDPNLAAILDELDLRVRESLAANAERVLFLTWAWSDYLDRAGTPWRIEGSIRGGERATLLVTAYRRLSDVRVRVGASEHRARLVRRADRTNVVELYLGQTSHGEDGALVVLDRVRDLALEDVWPLLDPAGDAELPPLGRAFAAAVRREATAALAPDVVAALVATAAARRRMEVATRTVRERRACGSRFGIGRLPWSGLSPRWRARVRAMGEAADPEDPCPSVTRAEADALASGAERMERTPGTHRALAALVAWLARGVTVHEARHVADDHALGSLEEPLDCEGCPTWMGATARAELSAFLASFAAPGLGYVNLFVACHETAKGRGPHSTAMTLVAARLGRGTCFRGPAPRDLYARAARLEREMLGRSEPVELPRSFPTRLWMD